MLTTITRRGRLRRALATLAFWCAITRLVALVSEPSDRAPAATAQRTSGSRNPLRALARPLAPPEHLRGVVRERLVAGSYAYLRVASESGPERWLVTLGAPRAIGACVEVTAYATASSFDSPRLRRRFDQLLFASTRACP